MFAIVNAPCTKPRYIASTMPGMADPPSHTSIKRLYQAAQTRGDTSPAQVARSLNISVQTLTNWGARGISKEGALQAQITYGCDANWLLGENTNPWRGDNPSSQNLRLDAGILNAALRMVERSLHDLRVSATPEARAEITMAAYDLIKEGHDMDAADRVVTRMLRAMGGMRSAPTE